MVLRFEKPAPAQLLAEAHAPTSTWTWPGNAPPKTSSALPSWHATILATTWAWPSKPPC
jgi:hypothetical protein